MKTKKDRAGGDLKLEAAVKLQTEAAKNIKAMADVSKMLRPDA